MYDNGVSANDKETFFNVRMSRLILFPCGVVILDYIAVLLEQQIGVKIMVRVLPSYFLEIKDY